ncbi:MAG: hypothetical protein ACLFU8_02845 [Anaerolineales bacterium]
MKRKSWLLVMVVSLLVLTLACTLFGGPDEPADTPEVGGGRGTGFEIEVDNRSDFDACYVLISPSASQEWGEDWLGGDEIIEPGDRRTFEVEDGTYDVMVLACNEATLATEWSIGSDATVRIGGSGKVALTVENESSVDVCYIFISPTTSDSWGEDWLGEKEGLVPADVRIFFIEPDVYDLQALDCDENILAEETDVDISDDLVWTLTGEGAGGGQGTGGSVELEVVNDSSEIICRVYIAPSASDNWGEDWLDSSEVIETGGAVHYFYIEPDTYDLLVEDCDGNEIVAEYNAALTEDTTWTIYDE